MGESNWLTLPHHTFSERKSGQEFKQGRDLEARNDAEAMEGAAYWVDLCGLLSLLSYRTQDHLPTYGSKHNGLGPAPSINQTPQACLEFSLKGSFPQLRGSPFR